MSTKGPKTKPLPIGKRYGRLILLEEVPTRCPPNRCGRFICDCGNIVLRLMPGLHYSTRTPSCGCETKERMSKLGKISQLKHGFAKRGAGRMPEYKSWQCMLRRCETKTNPNYKDYGGRGITVCEQWHSFEQFYADMGPKPENSRRVSIGRINNEGNYCPENCQWETVEQQARNKRNSRFVVLNGVRMIATDAEKLLGFKKATIINRLRKKGYAEDDPRLFVPVKHTLRWHKPIHD